MKTRLSVMVPSLNEEENLEDTINEIKSGLKGAIDNYEIIIFNDGSTDSTGKIAEKLAEKDKNITVFHNKTPRGMGYCYREGLKKAKHEYYMYIPGDNQFPGKALRKMLTEIGKADIVIPYVTNMNIRPLLRQLLSATFTHTVNILFGLNVSYYNGTVIHKKELLMTAIPKTHGHAYQAEILVRLIKRGASYTEVGYNMVERYAGSTSAFKLKNVKSVFRSVLSLFWELQLKPKRSLL